MVWCCYTLASTITMTYPVIVFTDCIFCMTIRAFGRTAWWWVLSVAQLQSTKGCFRNYPQGGPHALFCPVGGEFFWRVWGVGGVNLSRGSRRIWSIVGLGCPQGQGTLDSLCVLGVEGSKKKSDPPRIISGTAVINRHCTCAHYHDIHVGLQMIVCVSRCS